MPPSRIGLAPAQAQDAADYPSRTVRLIVPSSAGGPVDAVARILADAFKTVWKEPVVVESKPGAGNSTGALFVANSPPDGYTLLVISDSITVNPSLYPALNKDPLKQFEPISRAGDRAADPGGAQRSAGERSARLHRRGQGQSAASSTSLPRASAPSAISPR